MPLRAPDYKLQAAVATIEQRKGGGNATPTKLTKGTPSVFRHAGLCWETRPPQVAYRNVLPRLLHSKPDVASLLTSTPTQVDNVANSIRMVFMQEV